MRASGYHEITRPEQISGCGCLPIDRLGAYCKPCLRGEPCEVDPKQVEMCRRWLSDLTRPLKHIPRGPGAFGRYGSYGYKHSVEEWARRDGSSGLYIANGAFILAALLEGYRVRATGINAVFNIGSNRGRP